MSIDPLTEKYEDYTPYQFASNQPVHAGELEGMENKADLNKRKVLESYSTVKVAESTGTSHSRIPLDVTPASKSKDKPAQNSGQCFLREPKPLLK